MIDKTNTKFDTDLAYQELFLELKRTGQFGQDNVAEVKITPRDYVYATGMRFTAFCPFRVVIGDYCIRLHC